MFTSLTTKYGWMALWSKYMSIIISTLSLSLRKLLPLPKSFLQKTSPYLKCPVIFPRWCCLCIFQCTMWLLSHRLRGKGSWLLTCFISLFLFLLGKLCLTFTQFWKKYLQVYKIYTAKNPTVSELQYNELLWNCVMWV